MRSYIKVLTMCFLGLILFVPTALADNSVKRVGEAIDTALLYKYQSKCIQQQVQL